MFQGKLKFLIRAVTNKEQRLGIFFATVATLIETKRKLEQKEILSR